MVVAAAAGAATAGKQSDSRPVGTTTTESLPLSPSLTLSRSILQSSRSRTHVTNVAGPPVEPVRRCQRGARDRPRQNRDGNRVRRGRRLWRRFQVYSWPARPFREAPSLQHAAVRVGHRRVRCRCRRCRPHTDRRDPVRRLHLPSDGPDCQRGRQVPLQIGWRVGRGRADHSRALGGRRQGRPLPLVRARGLSHARGGPEGRHS